MERPRSILLFERLYLAGWAISLINTLMSLPARVALLAAQDGVEEQASGIIYAASAVGVLLPLLLWYLAARRASGVAKWILTVLFAISAAALLLQGARGLLSGDMPTVLTLLTFLFQAAGIVMLFRADARAWFGEFRDDDSADPDIAA